MYVKNQAFNPSSGSCLKPESDQLNERHESSNGATPRGNHQQEPLEEVAVLIIGAGPTGLLLAYLLSRLGTRSLVVEKYHHRLAAPKAHAINPRSFEICRQFGLDTTSIRSLGSPRRDAFWVNFVTNLSGHQIGRLPYERMDKQVLDATPEMIHNIPQPDFERFVEAHLALDSNVMVQRGVGFVAATQSGDQVITTVEERDTNVRYDIRSQYVVACDGAKSAVREYLNIKCDGEESNETMMTIHINADLRPILGASGVGMLHWILDPAVSGFIIGYDLSDNQVLICNFDSKRYPVASWTMEHARAVVAAAIGRSEVKFKVLSFRPWVLSRKVTQKYANESRRIFLCGDAAHAFPPTGGLGLNCGLADVHNLAYKLAANVQSWGSRALLDSYETERRPVAELYAQQSVKNGKKIFGFLNTLGLADASGSGVKDVEDARLRMNASVRDPAMQGVIEEEVEGQREHFDNLELHLGYVYTSDSYNPRNASDFTAKFVPGARLPHTWIRPRQHLFSSNKKPVDLSYVEEVSTTFRDARKFSSLDLVPIDGFAMIVGTMRDWQNSFETLRYRLAIRGVKILRFVAGEDYEFPVLRDGTAWMEQLGLSTGGGVIVRPDQHILMRFGKDRAIDEIENEILDHLGL